MQRKIADIGRQTTRFTDPTSVLLENDRANQARELREQLQGQVDTLRVQAEQIQRQIGLQGDVNGVLAMQANLVDENIGALERMRVSVTEVALLQIELWTKVSSIIRNNLGDAIKALVKGTSTLKDVLVSMFARLTDAAAEYIAQLIIMKTLQGGLGSGFGGGIGSLFGFKNGGSFKGSVKPFANGDIIRGPTLFGVAGESGTEAILPLTRIGGQPGGRTPGGTQQGMNPPPQAPTRIFPAPPRNPRISQFPGRLMPKMGSTLVALLISSHSSSWWVIRRSPGSGCPAQTP